VPGELAGLVCTRWGLAGAAEGEPAIERVDVQGGCRLIRCRLAASSCRFDAEIGAGLFVRAGKWTDCVGPNLAACPGAAAVAVAGGASANSSAALIPKTAKCPPLRLMSVNNTVLSPAVNVDQGANLHDLDGRQADIDIALTDPRAAVMLRAV